MSRSMVVGVGLVLAAQAAAAQVSYEGSLAASTGKYLFTEQTNSLVLNTGLSVRAGRLTLRASLPIWYQNTILVTASGAGTIPTGGPTGQGAVRDSGQARYQRGKGGSGSGGNGPGPGGGGGPGGPAPAGLGTPLFQAAALPAPTEALTGYEVMVADPMATATVRLIQGGRVTVSAGGTVKFPVADTAKIGTGKWDVGGQASVSVRLGRGWTLGLDGSYWRLGDLDSLELKDPLLGSASVGALIGNKWGVLFSVAGSTSMLTGFDPPVTVGAALSRLGAPGGWGINASAGLTETAPAFAVGAGWWIRF